MTPTRARRCRPLRLGGALVVLAVTAAACGGSESSTSEGSGGVESAEAVVSATLEIITTNIESSLDGGTFEEAEAGQELVVGDRVKTDVTGFAELTYHDGSWMRVESEATLTIDDLQDSDDATVVRSSIDTGQAWNRVQELSSPDDAYELDTPVASAAVRGTAFSVLCLGAAACTFSVLDGEVVITPVDGSEPKTLTAGERWTVTAGQPPGVPEAPGIAELSRDPFIAKNLLLDLAEDPALLPAAETSVGPDLGELFGGAVPVLFGQGTPEVLGCLGANAALVGRLDRRAATAGAGWSALDGEDLYTTMVVTLDCGAREGILAGWIPIVSGGFDSCVGQRFGAEPSDRLAALITGIDPSGLWAPQDPATAIAAAVQACTPPPTTAAPRRAPSDGDSGGSGGGNSGGGSGDSGGSSGGAPPTVPSGLFGA